MGLEEEIKCDFLECINRNEHPKCYEKDYDRCIFYMTKEEYKLHISRKELIDNILKGGVN